MSFICKNGTPHQHETIYESKLCWGIIRPPAPPTPVADLITKNQYDYIEILGGDLAYAKGLTKKRASDYIKALRLKPRPTPPSAPAQKARPVTDPRLDLIKGLIDAIPSGYYAVQPEEGAHISFLRISRPKVGAKTYGGSLKIQTQHGPMLEVAAVLWGGSGNWSIYKHSVISDLMLLLPDHHGAAMRYATKIGKCMRCNAALTDDRSRHYGIGPECEHKPGWGWVIPTRDEMNDGRSFETLRSLGLINLSHVS